MALAPLQEAFGVEAVLMTSMQAASGAGYPAVVLDILGNVIPFIAGEEEKVEAETRKMLAAEIPVPLCNRVGRTGTAKRSACARAANRRTTSRKALAAWRPAIADLGLLLGAAISSAPARPGQPPPSAAARSHRGLSAQSGMTVHIGRVRLLGARHQAHVLGTTPSAAPRAAACSTPSWRWRAVI